MSLSLPVSPLYAVPKRISGVMLSLTAVSGGAAIAVTWDTPVDDVAIDHYEVMFVVSQRPLQCSGESSVCGGRPCWGVQWGGVQHNNCWWEMIHLLLMEWTSTHARTTLNHPTRLSYAFIFILHIYTDVLFPAIEMVIPGKNSISLECSPSEGSPISYPVTWTPIPVLFNVSLICACMKDVVTTKTAVSSILLSGL